MTTTTNGTGPRRPLVLGPATAGGFAPGDLTSPARAAAAHALLDTTGAGPVTELRIHGVSGSNGPTMLEHPASLQVAGDAVAGFHRRWTPAAAGGTSAPWRLEAYSWGGLTEARLASASWILLAPFMLYNVAHYMLPARDGRERRYAVADGALRLLALTATLQMVLATLGALLDTGALQVVAARRPGWVTGAATVALLGVLGFLALLWYVGVRTANSYEARTAAAGATRAPAVETVRWPLAEPAFWRGKELVDRQRALHTAAALATVAILGALPGWGDLAHGTCLVAGLVVLVGAAAVLGSPAASRYEVTRREVGTRGGRVAVLVVAAGTALATIAVDADAGTWAARPDLTAQLTDAWLGLVAVQVGLLVVVAVAVGRFRRGPFLGGHLGTVVVTLAVLLGGLLSAVVAVAAARPFGSPVPSGRTLEALGDAARQARAAAPVVVAVPWPLYAFAAVVVGFVVGGVLAALWFVAVHRWRRVVQGRLVAQVYAAPVPDAPRRDPYRRARLRVAAAWATGDLADVAGPAVALVTAGGVLAVTGTTLLLGTSVLDGRLEPLLARGAAEGTTVVGPAASALTLVAVGVAAWLVALLRRAYSDTAERRTIGAVWDVGTFWPRATHPFAPPCYAERAVPEVVDRIAALTGDAPAEEVRVGPGSSTAPGPLTVAAGPVLLTGYSQGSIIAPAAVAQLPDGPRAQVALLTLACPARRLYGRAFPAFFGPEFLEVLAGMLRAGGTPPRWTNAVRRSDFIGSWVGRPPDTPATGAPLGRVDVWCDDPVALVGDGRPGAPLHRHSSWWPDPQVGVLAEELVDDLALRHPGASLTGR